MVDNVAVTPGTGATFATDDIGGIQYPRVKIAQGADGSGTDVSSAAPLNVTLANGSVPSHAVTNAGTFAVQVTSAPSTAVTNAGTFATQATLAAETTKNIGTVRVGDGTNTAVVKAASTAPVATDPALVVTISPNSQNANGTTTDANSTPVAWSTEGKAQLGAVTETAPASDTASSGLNGRLQRIAQNITTLIAATLKAALQTTTAGGSQVVRKIDLDETPVAIKASAGQVYGFYIVNRVTSPRYLRIYNVAAGSVTVGTTTPLLGPIEIPANASDHTALVVNFPAGIEFSTAISMAATTGFADNDTGAPGTNDLIANVLYK